MISHGRPVAAIAIEMRIKFGLTPLAAYRLALGLSQSDVVERYREWGSGPFVDQALLSRFESWPIGGKAPQATHIMTLATIYQTAPLELLDTEALTRLGETEREVLIRCNPGYAVASHVPASEVLASPAHAPARPLVRPAASNDSLQEVVEVAARRARRFITLQSSNVGPETLPQLLDDVSRVAQHYPRVPLVELLPELSELQDMTHTLLEGRQPPGETSSLYLLAGVIGGLMAKASHDTGDAHAAMTQARSAFMCAERIGHDGLAAWIRTLQSMIAYWSGRPHEAARYVEDGARLAAGVDGTVKVWVAAQHARVLGVLGDHEGVAAAVHSAVDVRDQVREDDLDRLGGILTFPQARQDYYAADANVWIPGNEQQTIQAATEAINAYAQAAPEDHSFSDEAGARCDLAVARVSLGELDGAAEALDPVLDLPVGQRIEGIAASMHRVHAALRGPQYRGAPLARDIQVQIEGFTALPSQAALPPGR
ncbi:hypothetical protein [Nonomuraea sp. NPDC059022]|uniref:hypothetical protein n=1 Tax=Nonomuraea sp. NPDC059022 TaxID=3346705 RepID=UPI0036B5AE28